jgi:hypothetical protein
MKFDNVNLALQSWNNELPVFILAQNPKGLYLDKCYTNCRTKIKRILYGPHPQSTRLEEKGWNRNEKVLFESIDFFDTTHFTMCLSSRSVNPSF